MKEYIERESVLNRCGWYNTFDGKSICAVRKDEISTLPAADVVKVVRCKDCKYTKGTWPIEGYFTCGMLRQIVTENDFCSFGERRESDG